MPAKVLNFDARITDMRCKIKDTQIAAAEGQLDRILGAIQMHSVGQIGVEASELLELIANDIVDYFKRCAKS